MIPIKDKKKRICQRKYFFVLADCRVKIRQYGSSNSSLPQSTGVVEYTDYMSAEG